MLNIRKKVTAGDRSSAQEEPNSVPQSPDAQPAAEFLQRLKNGDNDAWTQLTTEWGPRLYRYLRCHLPSAEDVEDVLSETMIATVRAIPRFDGKVAISTFIYSIANRKVADYWRQRKDISELPTTLTTAGPASESMEFHEALAQLPEQSRQAILLRYHLGLSVPEVAEAMGRSYKATESLLSRGRSQLKEALDKVGLQ